MIGLSFAAFLGRRAAAGGGGGGSSVYHHAVDAGPYTSTDTTYIDGVTTTIPAGEWQANTDYLAIWSAEVGVDVASEKAGARLYVDGVASRAQIIEARDATPNEYYPVSGIARVQVGASPASVTLAVKFNRAAGATGTARCRNAKITVLKLGTSDQFAEQATEQANSTTSYTTALSLNFTPGSAGDYLVIYSFSHGGASSAVRSDWRVGDGTTLLASGYFPQDNAERIPIVIAQRFNAMSGPKTFSVEIKTGTGGTNAYADDLSIVAIRLDRFSDVQTTALGADNTGTEDAYTTALSQTFTPAAGDYLTLGMWGMEGSSASISAYSQLTDGGSSLGETVHEPRIGTSNQGYMGGLMQTVATYAASSRTQAIQRKGETTGTTVRIKNGAMLASLRVDDLT